MKSKIVVSAMLALLLSVGISSVSNAAPWRGHRGYYGPRIGVRVWVPPVRVVMPPVRVVAPAPVVYGGVYGGGYCRPHYYARNYGYRHCGPRRCY